MVDTNHIYGMEKIKGFRVQLNIEDLKKNSNMMEWVSYLNVDKQRVPLPVLNHEFVDMVYISGKQEVRLSVNPAGNLK